MGAEVITTDGAEAITMDGAIITIGETSLPTVIILEEAASTWRLLFCDNSHLRCPLVQICGHAARLTGPPPVTQGRPEPSEPGCGEHSAVGPAL